MKILVACEESQSVTKEFRKLGHEAYSCDIEPCSGGHEEWHLQTDVLPLLKEKWDMIIAFPPCTHLAVSGARHFEKKRADGRQREAIEFFMQIINADCEKIVVENPVNILSGKYLEIHFSDLAQKYGLPLKPTQTIQPYQFGDEARKKTCLWIKGVELLEPTNVVSCGKIKDGGFSVGASANHAVDENGNLALEAQKLVVEYGGNRNVALPEMLANKK